MRFFVQGDRISVKCFVQGGRVGVRFLFRVAE